MKKQSDKKEIDKRKKYCSPKIQTEQILEVNLQACNKEAGSFQCINISPPPSES